MIRFMQKKNGHINYIPYNFNASFFIFISGICLANNPHFQQGKDCTLYLSSRDLFLIMKDIINVFCLN